MRGMFLAAGLMAGAVFGGTAMAQEPFQTAQGRACIDQWAVYVGTTLNGFSGDQQFNNRKPWSINQYGFFIGRGISSAFEPDNWGDFGRDRATYMWFLYDSPEAFPTWNNSNFNGAGLQGLRSYVAVCVAEAGGSGTGAGAAGGGATAGGSGAGAGGGASGSGGASGGSGGSTSGGGGTTGGGATVGAGGTTVPSTTGLGGGAVPTSAMVPDASARCPDSLSPLSTYPGVILGCTCQSDQLDEGSVWGSHPYTFDSDLCRAAVHAGAIPMTGGVVWSQVTGTLPSYAGTTRNGITTTDYTEYGPSMTILNAAPAGAANAFEQVAACPSNMTNQTGLIRCHCSASRLEAGGGLWGTFTYTHDSNLCAAARHSGVLGVLGGIVRVERVPDAGSYSGSERNGLSSSDYGAYSGAFLFR